MERCYGKQFSWRESTKIAHHTFIMFVGIQQQTTDRKIATRMHVLRPPMTPDKYVVNFGSVTHEFCGLFVPGGLHAGLCHTRPVVIIQQDK